MPPSKFNAKFVGVTTKRPTIPSSARASATAQFATSTSNACHTGWSKRWHLKRIHSAHPTPGNNSSVKYVKLPIHTYLKRKARSIDLWMWSCLRKEISYGSKVWLLKRIPLELSTWLGLEFKRMNGNSAEAMRVILEFLIFPCQDVTRYWNSTKKTLRNST